MKKLLLIISIFCVFSCQNNKAFEKNDKIVKSLYDKDFSPKMQILGKNQIISKSWINENGNIVRNYSVTRKIDSFKDYLPIISYFIPKNYENFEIIVTFDKKNNISKKEDFYNIIKMKSGLFCNPPAFSCVKMIN